MSGQDKIKADFQQIANDDAEFREIVGYSGITVMESHQAWCGPCDCIRPNLWKLSLADESLKFATACSDKVPLLKDYMGKVQPIFFIYKGGKKLATIEGVNGEISFPILSFVIERLHKRCKVESSIPIVRHGLPD